MRIVIRSLAVTLALLTQGIVVTAQSERTSEPKTFDVVSVRRNVSGTTQQSITPQPGAVTMVNVPLRVVLQLAYGIQQPTRLIGLPEWAGDRYDISARMSGPGELPSTLPQMRPMMQAMLAERFKLSARIEARVQDAYAMVMARSDRKPGPGLKSFTGICAGRATPAATGAPPATGTQPVPCGPRGATGVGRFDLAGTPLPLFASMLSLIAGRPVVNKTGLDGLWDIDLRYTLETGPGAADANSPSLFTALQEQLGLKLDPERESVEVLVVDRVERPTEN
jgi:uncharacterized protein (TIGR03435 family)